MKRVKLFYNEDGTYYHMYVPTKKEMSKYTGVYVAGTPTNPDKFFKKEGHNAKKED